MKPWQQKSPKKRSEAKVKLRKVLIVCEDEKSSCYYFKAFEVNRERLEVKAIGTGMNTSSLVEHACKLKNKAEDKGEPYNEVWCVLDRDSFPQENYLHAFHLAGANRISIAWANEAFELWYLLHFNYHDTGMSRTEYAGRLEKLLKHKYDKGSKNTYKELKDRQKTAIHNAKMLEQNLAKLKNPQLQNPSTSVHKLVEFLNQYIELDMKSAV